MDRTLVLDVGNQRVRLRIYDLARRGKTGTIVNYKDPTTGKQYGTTTDPGEDLIDAIARVTKAIHADQR